MRLEGWPARAKVWPAKVEPCLRGLEARLVDERVRIHGSTSLPELNGRWGRVMSVERHDTSPGAAGRVGVQLEACERGEAEAVMVPAWSVSPEVRTPLLRAWETDGPISR